MAGTDHLIKQFFERASCSLALLDRGFNYICVNQKFADQYGRPVDFFPAKSHIATYSPGLQEQFEIARETKSLIQIPAQSPGDPEVPITSTSWALDPILNDEDDIDFFVLAELDVTDTIQTERSQQESEDWFRCLSEFSSEAMIIYENNVIRNFNRAAFNLFGYSAEEYSGQSLLTFVAPESRELIIEMMRDKPDSPYEAIAMHKDGRRIPVEIHAQTVLYAGGKARCVVLRDISERQKAKRVVQKSEAMFRQAARLAQLGHWARSEDEDRLVEISNEYARIIGLPADEVLSHYATRTQINETIHADDRERYWQVIAESDENVKGYDIEYRLLRPSGEVRYVREVGEPVVDREGKMVRTVGTLQNINQIKQAEIEIIAAKNEAEFANNAKSEFLARMSHELRTPLNAVLGFGQLLEMDNDKLTVAQNEGISHIIAGGRHLLQLIDEVLDIARVDSGNLEISMEAVSLDQALGEAMLLISPLAARQNIILEELSNNDFRVFADERRLKQVLVNLLSNAVKYNRAGGMVKVRHDAIEDGLIRIAVSDTGLGIRAEDQATLFEPFTRVGGTAHSAEGTGIGLTITKRLVELMGGVIGFESEYGKGTTFWIVLPGAPESNEVRTAADWTIQPAISDRLKDLKILYVEDIPINLELMRQLIKRITGHDLLCATNARDGIDIAKTQQPDLILMDISLPGMDGFEALDVLKADDDTARIPVMALTAHATREQIKSAQETAFEDYLIKPVIINQLIAALNDVVRGVPDSE